MDNERISIEGGCNVLTSSYSIREGKAAYGPWASTKRFCNEDHDNEIMRAFEGVGKISAYAGKIYLYDSNGGKIMKLKKIE